MAVSIFIILCDLCIPLIIWFIGIFTENHVPKKINGTYGYRTKLSMESKEAWKFANEQLAKSWKKLGIWMLGITVIVAVLLTNFGEMAQGIGCIILVLIQTIAVIASIPPIQKALKNRKK